MTAWVLAESDRVYFRAAETRDGRLQVYWNWNITADSKGEYWANFIEIGPGVRVRVPVFTKPILFGVNALRGHTW